jgi:hypothetical protein
MNKGTVQKINFLQVEIGRGHPFYLDGIISGIPADRLGMVQDVVEMARGSSRLAWRLVRAMYHLAASGGWAGVCYSQLRRHNDYNQPGLMLKWLGRDIRRLHAHGHDPLVVAHPILAAILKGRPNLFYQHGELVAPGESLVRGDHKVLVPLSSTAGAFRDAGIPAAQIEVTGLCIEPALVAQADDAFQARLVRINGKGPLTGAVFSSGAEPWAHVKAMVAAALSAVQAGGRIRIFAHRHGRLEKYARAGFVAGGLALNSDISAPAECRACLCLYESRRDLDALTARFFTQFDYFISPSHERSNWAMGLGLPMLMVGPPIGSFAPLNWQLLLNAGVARPLGHPLDFGAWLAQQQADGALTRLATAGYGRYPIDGFARIVERILSDRL